MTNVDELFTSISAVLAHIESVQKEIIAYSFQSTKEIIEFISDSNIEADEHVVKAMQHQDIVSQQLGATNEAINNIIKSIEIYKHSVKEDSGLLQESLRKLDRKLQESLEKAKDRKSAFEGNIHNENDDNVEFF